MRESTAETIERTLSQGQESERCRGVTKWLRARRESISPRLQREHRLQQNDLLLQPRLLDDSTPNHHIRTSPSILPRVQRSPEGAL